jgi:preprotein translocase subunit SecA
MTRLGVKHGDYIESGMVTRAVEKAQKRVEAMHFEARKHLLEYDDVANAQRKLIYAFRRELMTPNLEIKQRIVENLRLYLDGLFNECGVMEGVASEEFAFDKLTKTLREELKIETINANASLNAVDLRSRVEEEALAQYEQKVSVLAPEQRNEIERILYLQSLDEMWREHLYQMDVLKTGIGLRGYNQKDPLVEYKKESYQLFGELTANLKLAIIKTLFGIRFRTRDEQEAISRMREQMEKAAKEELTYSASSNANRAQAKIEKKIPRNAPCPCGSGKKYKNCHGQSGPKRGVFAPNS